MESIEVVTVECPCGNIFEPDKLQVDQNGDRWTVCPKCGQKVPVTELD